ncbi:MAG: hypothetical protein H6603_08135 [Flavobacteriales bacterium]|nr:hypothetical protein [Flavobacteriales bacterium]
MKETYVVFFVPFLLMGLFAARHERQSPAFRVAVAGIASIVIYLIAYVLLSGSQTDVFYFEKYDDSLLYGLLWLTFLNPMFFTVIIFLSFLVAKGKNSFIGTRIVLISVLAVCAFFIFTSIAPMGYLLSIVYPFLFFTTQIELSSLIERNYAALKVLVPLLIVLTLYSGLILAGISGLHIVGRGHHFSVLEFVEKWGQENNAQFYIYKGKHYDFRKTQIGVALHFIANGWATMETEADILEIESAPETPFYENAVVFIPKEDLFSNQESLSSNIIRTHPVDSLIRIWGFEYDVILLNRTHTNVHSRN